MRIIYKFKLIIIMKEYKNSLRNIIIQKLFKENY